MIFTQCRSNTTSFSRRDCRRLKLSSSSIERNGSHQPYPSHITLWPQTRVSANITMPLCHIGTSEWNYLWQWPSLCELFRVLAWVGTWATNHSIWRFVHAKSQPTISGHVWDNAIWLVKRFALCPSCCLGIRMGCSCAPCFHLTGVAITNSQSCVETERCSALRTWLHN